MLLSNRKENKTRKANMNCFTNKCKLTKMTVFLSHGIILLWQELGLETLFIALLSCPVYYNVYMSKVQCGFYWISRNQHQFIYSQRFHAELEAKLHLTAGYSNIIIGNISHCISLNERMMTNFL